MADEILISDKQLKKIFTPSFVQYFKDQSVIYPITDHGSVSGGCYLWYPTQEFAKITQIYHRYQQHTSPQELEYLRLSLHGIIPRHEFDRMRQSSWWPIINQKIVNLFPGQDISLDSLITPFVRDVVLRPQAHRHLIRRYKI